MTTTVPGTGHGLGTPGDRSVASPAMTIERVGILGSGIRGRASPKWRPSPASRWCSAPQAGVGRRHGGGPREVAGPPGRAASSSRPPQTRSGHGSPLRTTSAPWSTATWSSNRSSRTWRSRSRCSRSSTRSSRTRPSWPPTPPPCRWSTWRSPPSARTDVCGVHFFNPAPAAGPGRDRPPAHRVGRDDRAVTEFRVGLRQDPVQVKDQAGFIVNALLFPTSTTPCGCSRTAPPPPKTSTPR